ncbi:MAG: head-tail adaptor protein [Candidatus Caldarchaeum sp.]
MTHPMRLEVDTSPSPDAGGHHVAQWQVLVDKIYVALEPLSASEFLQANKEADVYNARVTFRHMPQLVQRFTRVRLVSLIDGKAWHLGLISPPDSDGYVSALATDLEP